MKKIASFFAHLIGLPFFLMGAVAALIAEAFMQGFQQFLIMLKNG